MSNKGRLLERAQRAFNRFIKERDSDNGLFTCISCQQQLPKSEFTAGHYIGASQTNILRFCEENVWGQCRHCNCEINGNLASFRIELTKRIGMKRLLELESQANTCFTWSNEELNEIITRYKVRITE